MTEEEEYSVTDVEGYCISIAKKIAEGFSCKIEELYQYCSLSEIKNIIEENCIGHDEKNQPIITFNVHEIINENVLQRIYNFMISKLASEGHLECAWDENKNEMVFWRKEK